jgi:hypothetical protein
VTSLEQIEGYKTSAATVPLDQAADEVLAKATKDQFSPRDAALRGLHGLHWLEPVTRVETIVRLSEIS